MFGFCLDFSIDQVPKSIERIKALKKLISFHVFFKSLAKNIFLFNKNICMFWILA